jgi:hypothetical protein
LVFSLWHRTPLQACSGSPQCAKAFQGAKVATFRQQIKQNKEKQRVKTAEKAHGAAGV